VAKTSVGSQIQRWTKVNEDGN